MKKLLIQLSKFGLIGIIATIIDFIVLFIATELFKTYYLFSAALGFIISTLFNYSASMNHVFETKFTHNDRHKELSIFIILSVLGLVINQLLMWLFVEDFNIYYIHAKFIATGFVMLWNFISRKLFLEKRT